MLVAGAGPRFVDRAIVAGFVAILAGCSRILASSIGRIGSRILGPCLIGPCPRGHWPSRSAAAGVVDVGVGAGGMSGIGCVAGSERRRFRDSAEVRHGDGLVGLVCF